MTQPLVLFTAAGLGAAAIAALGALADHRRMTRRDPDAVGWVPWRGVSFAATFVALLALSVATVLWMRG